MCIPCYLFLATLPSRVTTIQSAGIPGRQQINIFKNYEMAKKAMIALLLIYYVRELVGPAPEVADPSQIDSSSQPSRFSRNFELVV